MCMCPNAVEACGRSQAFKTLSAVRQWWVQWWNGGIQRYVYRWKQLQHKAFTVRVRQRYALSNSFQPVGLIGGHWHGFNVDHVALGLLHQAELFE